MSKKKLFLIDAYALIYRAYYAFIKNPRINSKGFDTSAIMGFMNSLLDLIKRESPENLAVEASHEVGTNRTNPSGSSSSFPFPSNHLSTSYRRRGK